MLDPAGPRTAFWGFGNAWVRGAIDDGGAFYRSVSYEGVGGLISIGLDWGLARWRRTEVRLFFFFFFGEGRRSSSQRKCRSMLACCADAGGMGVRWPQLSLAPLLWAGCLTLEPALPCPAQSSPFSLRVSDGCMSGRFAQVPPFTVQAQGKPSQPDNGTSQATAFSIPGGVRQTAGPRR